MKAALTVWDGRMSPVFDVRREALILTIENGAVAARSIESIGVKLAMETAQCPIDFDELKVTLENKFGVKVILGTHSY